MTVLVVLMLLAVQSVPLSAMPDTTPRYLTIETWTIDDSIIHSQDDPEERLLSYARHDLSGMIYGYEFRYVPSDRARQISEVFELTPIASVRWGAPGLRTRDVERHDGTLYGLFEYELSEVERLWTARWDSVRIPDSGGVGRAELLEGVAGRE